jgi:hypothetical protein
MLSLSENGYAGAFTDIMHMYVITVPVTETEIFLLFCCLLRIVSIVLFGFIGLRFFVRIKGYSFVVPSMFCRGK